ncbi:hypothetical protein Tco_0449823 [Tanacetum coccineum]
MYCPRFTKVIIHHFLTQDKTVSWRNKIGMYTSKDDYLINTLRFVSVKEETQIYGVVLPESLTSPEMKETKANKTYLGFATGATPPKKARKFKKLASPQITTVPVLVEEPTGKSKRVKRHAKKSTKAPARGVVIRETPEMPFSKKKEKVDVTRGKGIKLLSQVALTEDAQYEEVRRKSMRDFHKTHPSGSGTVTKTAPSAAKIKPSVTNKGTDVIPGVPDVTEEESSKKNENESNSKNETDENESGSESDQEGNEEEIRDDEEEVKDRLVKTPSNDSDDEDETKITDKAKGDEDEEMDYTTSQLYDDVDIRLNEPVDTDKGFIQKEGIDAELTNIQQGNENPKISQVIEDAHLIISTIPQKTKVPVTSSSHSSDLAAKFLNFLDIPHTDAEIVSPMDVHVHHEVLSQQTPTLPTVPVSVITDSSPIYSTVIPHSLPSFTPPPQQSTSTPPPTTEATNAPSTLLDFTSVFQFNNRVTTLEKEVAELKNDPLHTQVTTLVDDHLDARLGATRDELMNFLSVSLTTRITEQVKNQLPQILPEEVSNFTPCESYLETRKHKECYEGLIKSYDLDKTILSTYAKVYSLKRSQKDKDKDEDPSAGSNRGLKKRKTSKDVEPTKEEPKFEVADSDMPQDQEENPSNDDEEPKEKVASKRDSFTKPTQP